MICRPEREVLPDVVTFRARVGGVLMVLGFGCTQATDEGSMVGDTEGSSSMSSGRPSETVGTTGETAGVDAGNGAASAGTSGSSAAGPSSSAGPTTTGTSEMTTGGGASTTSGASACVVTDDHIRVTEVDVGMTVIANEDEARLMPLSISPIPAGGSRIAWMSDDGQVHIGSLDAADQWQGVTASLPAHDFADLHADQNGGVVLLTRDALGSGDNHCGTLTNLCGPVESLPAQFECWDMFLVRFDGSSETWATRLTESAADLPPYLDGPNDDRRVIYIWEAYAHHGRIAASETAYAAYFGAAISVSETCFDPNSTLPQAINIHQGDRMNVVSTDGTLLDHPDDFAWGCSHSGYERVLYDEAQEAFVSVCKTDNNNRIAFAPSYTTIRPIDLAYSNLGDLVSSTVGGVWLPTSDIASGQPSMTAGNAEVLLLHTTGGEADMVVPVASDPSINFRAPHLASYGDNHLLVAYESSTEAGDLSPSDPRTLWVQAHTRDTGEATGDPVAVDVPGNRYNEFVGFPDGSAAYLAPGSSPTSIRVLRVLPCGN